MCQKSVCVGEPGCSEYLGLPRLPNWIVPSDMADLHNLVVSFTVSHGPGDEWHQQKIIFLLGCNKSYVKCSIAYMAEMWYRIKTHFFFLTLPPFTIFPSSPSFNSYKQQEVWVEYLKRELLQVKNVGVTLQIARFMYDKYHWSCCMLRCIKYM